MCIYIVYSSLFWNTLQHWFPLTSLSPALSGHHRVDATHCNNYQHTATTLCWEYVIQHCELNMCVPCFPSVSPARPAHHGVTATHYDLRSATRYITRWSIFASPISQVCLQQDLHITKSCNTLQHIATHCNTLQHTVTLCDEYSRAPYLMRVYLQQDLHVTDLLQHAATYLNCNTLQHCEQKCWVGLKKKKIWRFPRGLLVLKVHKSAVKINLNKWKLGEP